MAAPILCAMQCAAVFCGFLLSSSNIQEKKALRDNSTIGPTKSKRLSIWRKDLVYSSCIFHIEFTMADLPQLLLAASQAGKFIVVAFVLRNGMSTKFARMALVGTRSLRSVSVGFYWVIF